MSGSTANRTGDKVEFGVPENPDALLAASSATAAVIDCPIMLHT